MRLAGLGLVFAFAVASQATAQSCPSAKLLDDVWLKSFSAVEQAMAAAQRGEKVDLAGLERHVSTLGTISGAEADVTYFGYLPDEKLRAMMSRWREWHSRGSSELCAPLMSNGVETGCAGQQKFARLWLANTRSLERMLQNLESERAVSRDEFEEAIGFFGRATGLAGSGGGRLPIDASSRLDLMTLVVKWQDWFADHIGGMCGVNSR
jgi:hypothetical protein